MALHVMSGGEDFLKSNPIVDPIEKSYHDYHEYVTHTHYYVGNPAFSRQSFTNARNINCRRLNSRTCF